MTNSLKDSDSTLYAEGEPARVFSKDRLIKTITAPLEDFSPTVSAVMNDSIYLAG